MNVTYLYVFVAAESENYIHFYTLRTDFAQFDVAILRYE